MKMGGEKVDDRREDGVKERREGGRRGERDSHSYPLPPLPCPAQEKKREEDQMERGCNKWKDG